MRLRPCYLNAKHKVINDKMKNRCRKSWPENTWEKNIMQMGS